MKFKILATVILAALLFITAGPTFAAKKRIRNAPQRAIKGGYSFSKVSFFPNRLGINLNFFNLGQVSKVSYVLSYTGSGKSQGIVGSFAPVGVTDARQLLFGTCSSGTCVYHEGIKNAKLTLTFTLKNGKSAVKRYIFKV